MLSTPSVGIVPGDEEEEEGVLSSRRSRREGDCSEWRMGSRLDGMKVTRWGRLRLDSYGRFGKGMGGGWIREDGCTGPDQRPFLWRKNWLSWYSPNGLAW